MGKKKQQQQPPQPPSQQTSKGSSRLPVKSRKQKPVSGTARSPGFEGEAGRSSAARSLRSPGSPRGQGLGPEGLHLPPERLRHHQPHPQVYASPSPRVRQQGRSTPLPPTPDHGQSRGRARTRSGEAEVGSSCRGRTTPQPPDMESGRNYGRITPLGSEGDSVYSQGRVTPLSLEGEGWDSDSVYQPVYFSGSHPRLPRSARDVAAPHSLTPRPQPASQEAGTGGRRMTPRRHTVAVADTDVVESREELYKETERKREAFMELLAMRYPEYADRISGSFSDSECPDRQAPRGREHARRRTTVVTYDPGYPRSLAGDDVGTMSDVEMPSFQRGGFGRQSLPIVRSQSSSFDRPLGLVFLVYGNETKRALLPNEITTLDTVRALFVRSFPEKLSMELLESPKNKIYIMEHASKIFFQLEDLRDIKDRSVLKIHECPDSQKPQVVKEVLPCRGRSVSHPIQPGPRPRPPSRAGEPVPFRDDMAKSQSLPAKPPHVYRELLEEQGRGWDTEPRSRSRSQTPELMERPKSLPVQPRRPFSPERQTTPERGSGHLGPIPEDYQLLNGNSEVRSGPPPHASSVGHGYPHVRTLSPPSMGHVGGPMYENVYRDPHGYPPSVHMVHSVRAAPLATNPQRATGVDMRDGARRSHSNNRHSLAFAPMTGGPAVEGYLPRSQNYRVTPERELQAAAQPVDPNTRHRIDKMEMQLANLTAWVHSSVGGKGGQEHPAHTPASSTVSESTSDVFPASTASSMSDIPSTVSPPSCQVTPEMKQRLCGLQVSARELRRELLGLRRLQQINTETMHESLGDAIMKIKRMLEGSPGLELLPLQRERCEVGRLLQAYRTDKDRVERELSDLEASVEELRTDVITRQCRVNMADVDGMAVILSNITKTYADLKARFPAVQQRMKSVMSGEMEVVVSEEKFLKEEPEKIESALKRCKKLTGTLYTLKRLASVQEHRPIKVPDIAKGNSAPGEEEKKAILDNIRAMVPNHSQRLSSLEAADQSRERKKKILTQHDSLMFCKSLELTTKKLKSAESSHEPSPESSKSCTPDPEPSSPVHVQHTEGGASGPPATPPTQAKAMSTLASAPPTLTTSSPLVTAGVAVTSSGVGPLAAAPSSLVSTSSSVAFTEVSPVVVQPKVAPSSPPDLVAPKLDGGEKKPDLLAQKNAARAAFFSSLASPPVSPPSSATMDYTVRISPVRVTSTSGEVTSPTYTVSSPSVLKGPETAPKPAPPKMDLKAAFLSSSSSPPGKGVKKVELSPTQTRFGMGSSGSSSSSIPRPSAKFPSPSGLSTSAPGGQAAEVETKTKKVPPPPPPRKSSRLPSSAGQGFFPMSMNGSTTSQIGHVSATKPETKVKSSGPTSPPSGSKPVTPRKPTSLFERDLAAGIYANLNRPDLQSQKVTPEVVLNRMDCQKRAQPQPEAREEREGSSDSTGSSTSLDSQKGVVMRRPQGSVSSPPVVSTANTGTNCLQRPPAGTSSASATSSDSSGVASDGSAGAKGGAGSRNSHGKKPKPEPPERRSSLHASASATTSSFRQEPKQPAAGGSSAPPGVNGVKDKSSTLPYGETEIN